MALPESKNRDQSPQDGSDVVPDVKSLMPKEAWHDSIEPAVAEAHASGKALCAVLIDLDYFKDVNDMLGHAIGDEVLDKVIEIISKTLRKDETIGRPEPDIVSGPETSTVSPEDEDEGSRLGGDEFGILAWADLPRAKIMVDRIESKFNAWRDLEENKELRKTAVGMAFGIAELEPEMTGIQLLKKADENLYDDKIAKIPELTPHQRRAIEDAKAILKAAGVTIRMRDFPKYGRKYPELFED